MIKKLYMLLMLLAIQLNDFNSSFGQSLSYIYDSTSFNALTLDGGNVEMEFADINNDGHLDIITVGDHGSPNINTNQHGITVFFGNGTGTGWTLFQTGDFGYGGIATGDLNNDRWMDVAYGIHHDYSSTDFGDQLLEAALGDGTGQNWIPWDDSLASNGETYGMMGTDLGDEDNDGLLDIASASFGCCAGVHIYKNNGTGVWTQTFGFINGNNMNYIQFGDINHDGNLDFACCHQSGCPYFGNGNGGFTLNHGNLPSVGTLGFLDVSLGDIDNDGDDDLCFITNSQALYVYKWNQTTQQWVNSGTGLSGGSYWCARMADVNSDGFTDIVSVSTGNVKIWTGNGGASWQLANTIPAPNLINCSDIAVDDVDHNGMPDILFWADYYTGLFSSVNRLRILRNDSVAAQLNIRMTYPKGRECIPAQAVRFIRWTSAVPQGHLSGVKIELSTSGINGPYTLVENSVANNGRFQWTAPAGIISDSCHLRLIVTDSVTLLTDTVVNALAFQVGTCNPALAVNNTTVATTSVLTVNPPAFTSSAMVNFSAITGDIYIYDNTGRMVKTFKDVNFPFVLHRETLNSGMYVIKATAGNKVSGFSKFILH